MRVLYQQARNTDAMRAQPVTRIPLRRAHVDDVRRSISPWQHHFFTRFSRHFHCVCLSFFISLRAVQRHEAMRAARVIDARY